jgi:hypothetical protein
VCREHRKRGCVRYLSGRVESGGASRRLRAVRAVPAPDSIASPSPPACHMLPPAPDDEHSQYHACAGRGSPRTDLGARSSVMVRIGCRGAARGCERHASPDSLVLSCPAPGSWLTSTSKPRWACPQRAGAVRNRDFRMELRCRERPSVSPMTHTRPSGTRILR